MAESRNSGGQVPPTVPSPASVDTPGQAGAAGVGAASDSAATSPPGSAAGSAAAPSPTSPRWATARARRSLTHFVRGTWCAGTVLVFIGTWALGQSELPPLVIAGRVVTDSHLVVGILVAALLLWALTLVLIVVRLATPFQETPLLWRRILRRTIRTVTTVFSLGAVPILGLVLLLEGADLPTAAHHLQPDAPGGCRVFALVEPAYEGWDTRFFVVEPGSISATPVRGAWSTGKDGPADPIVSQPWSLEWTGDTGTLTWGSGVDADDNTVTIVCPPR